MCGDSARISGKDSKCKRSIIKFKKKKKKEERSKNILSDTAAATDFHKRLEKKCWEATYSFLGFVHLLRNNSQEGDVKKLHKHSKDLNKM